MNLQKAPPASSDLTRERIKAAALRLFSAQGIDGVSVRDIVKAAGQKNGASLHYHFGTKDALVQELIADGARRSDRARARRLDVLEAAGGPRSVEEIVRLIVQVETEPMLQPDGRSLPIGFGHMRFIMALQVNHQALLNRSLVGGWNNAYLRCLRWLRKLLPQVPPAVLNQRFVFMFLTIASTLAIREAALERDPGGGRLWGDDRALENLIVSIGGMLRAPVDHDPLT